MCVINSVASVHPELLSEWSERNEPLTPDDITYGSNKKVWWKGKCGHEWLSSPKSRHAGSGCPYCSGNAILKGYNDLASLHPDLALEWSEKNHKSAGEYTEHSPFRALWKCKNGHEWFANIADRVDGSGCPYCAGQRLYQGFNDLETLYPNIAKEWSSNNKKKANEHSPKSRENVLWICPDCGHEYKAVIDARVKGLFCPLCSNYKVITGKNDLLTTDPDVCKEWNYEKNENWAKPIFPNKISRNALYYAWWKGECGHEWKDRISNRTILRAGCLKCESEFIDALPQLAFIYYARMKSLRVLVNDESVIGIAVDILMPDISLAVDYLKIKPKGQNDYQELKKFVCDNQKISYRILFSSRLSDPIKIVEAIRRVLQEHHIYISSDIETDVSFIRKSYFAWKSK